MTSSPTFPVWRRTSDRSRRPKSRRLSRRRLPRRSRPSLRRPRAVQPEAVQLEEEDEEEAPRWAAIPIVTSEDEPVAVVASGATAAADLEYAPEPFAPWAASQAYTTYVEPAPAEESAPAEQSEITPAEEAAAVESAAVETAAPAEQSSAEAAQEPEGSHREPWVAAALAPSEPDEAVPDALAEQSWSAPDARRSRRGDDESEAARTVRVRPSRRSPRAGVRALGGRRYARRDNIRAVRTGPGRLGARAG